MTWFNNIKGKAMGLIDGEKLKQEKQEKDEVTEKQDVQVKKFQAYIQSWIDEGKKRGMDEDQAIKWAKRKIEERAEKARAIGQLIKCDFCGQPGVTHHSGGMMRKPDGTYVHQNCNKR